MSMVDTPATGHGGAAHQLLLPLLVHYSGARRHPISSKLPLDGEGDSSVVSHAPSAHGLTLTAVTQPFLVVLPRAVAASAILDTSTNARSQSPVTPRSSHRGHP